MNEEDPERDRATQVLKTSSRSPCYVPREEEEEEEEEGYIQSWRRRTRISRKEEAGNGVFKEGARMGGGCRKNSDGGCWALHVLRKCLNFWRHI